MIYGTLPSTEKVMHFIFPACIHIYLCMFFSCAFMVDYLYLFNQLSCVSFMTKRLKLDAQDLSSIPGVRRSDKFQRLVITTVVS